MNEDITGTFDEKTNTETAPPEILGNPEMLDRLRRWAVPICGHLDDGSLLELQTVLEDGFVAFGIVPQYRKPQPEGQS